MGWKRSTATQKPLSAPARMPAPNPAPSASRIRDEEGSSAMRVTMITLAIETIAPKEVDAAPDHDDRLPTATSMSGTKSNKFPLSNPGWKKFGCR